MGLKDKLKNWITCGHIERKKRRKAKAEAAKAAASTPPAANTTEKASVTTTTTTTAPVVTAPAKPAPVSAVTQVDNKPVPAAVVSKPVPVAPVVVKSAPKPEEKSAVKPAEVKPAQVLPVQKAPAPAPVMTTPVVVPPTLNEVKPVENVTPVVVPVKEPEKVAVTLPPAAPKLVLFTNIERLPNTYKDTPAGQFLKNADCLRVKFKKLAQDPTMPKEFIDELPKFEAMVKELHESVENKERNRARYHGDENLSKRKEELEDQIDLLSIELEMAKANRNERLAELTQRKNAINEHKTKIATLEVVAEIKAALKSYYDKYVEEMHKLEKALSERKTGLCPCSFSDEKNEIRDKLDRMKKNLTNFGSDTKEKVSEGGHAILSFFEENIKAEENALSGPFKLDGDIAELKENLKKIAAKIEQEAIKYPYTLSRDAMLKVVRFYEASAHMIHKINNHAAQSVNETMTSLKQTFRKHMHKLLTKADKLFCPDMNDFHFGQFHEGFSKLTDAEQKSVIDGDRSHDLIDRFMPEHNSAVGFRA